MQKSKPYYLASSLHHHRVHVLQQRQFVLASRKIKGAPTFHSQTEIHFCSLEPEKLLQRWINPQEAEVFTLPKIECGFPFSHTHMLPCEPCRLLQVHFSKVHWKSHHKISLFWVNCQTRARVGVPRSGRDCSGPQRLPCPLASCCGDGSGTAE